MEQLDLLPSMTIDQDFPGKASHCNTFFLSRSVEFTSRRRRIIMGKDAKGKGKTRAKKVKGGKRAAEKEDVTESTDSLRNTLTAEMSSLGYVS